MGEFEVAIGDDARVCPVAHDARLSALTQRVAQGQPRCGTISPSLILLPESLTYQTRKLPQPRWPNRKPRVRSASLAFEMRGRFAPASSRRVRFSHEAQSAPIRARTGDGMSVDSPCRFNDLRGRDWGTVPQKKGMLAITIANMPCFWWALSDSNTRPTD